MNGLTDGSHGSEMVSLGAENHTLMRDASGS